MDTKTKILVGFVFVVWLVAMSCTIPSMFNSDSYGKKWDNTFIWFNPNDLDTIYISKTGSISDAKPAHNGLDYRVDWEEKNGKYRLSVISFSAPIFALYFEGYDTNDVDEELPWIFNGLGYVLESNKLLPPVNGFYEIVLSENLTK